MLKELANEFLCSIIGILRYAAYQCKNYCRYLVYIYVRTYDNRHGNDNGKLNYICTQALPMFAVRLMKINIL